jgi:hypothetical protein
MKVVQMLPVRWLSWVKYSLLKIVLKGVEADSSLTR